MIKNSYPGKFIVIEGLDGSGKSAQINLIIKFLEENNKDVLVTKEPTGETEAGRKIKQALLKEIIIEPLELQKLFVEDRKAHLKNQIIPVLKSGKIVVSSRYAFSTIAYGRSDGLDIDSLIKMNYNFIMPDLTVIVDVLPESCIERIEGSRPLKELFERKEKLAKARDVYKMLPVMFKNVFLVDGEKPINEVFENIKKLINGIL